MDSTIIEEESLDQLGKLIGQEKNIIKITEDAMNGIIDFEEALIRRVAKLKGHSADILDLLKEKINTQITFYIPTISLIDIDVNFEGNEHSLFIIISYSFNLDGSEDAIQLNFNSSYFPRGNG